MKKHITTVVIATLMAANLLPTTSYAELLTTDTPASSMPGSFADIVEKLSPAVVNISTKQKVTSGGMQGFGFPFGGLPNHPGLEQFNELFRQFEQMQRPQEREVTSLGSGFVISAEGYIITNSHVIHGADQITVRFSDDTELEAKLIGDDKKTDLALLKVESKKPLEYVPFGDSDKARVGDWVIAIGNPFGLGGTVTTGIISARQRSINAGPYDDFIQTDAAINRGNSGGPLFNTKGEVIGINSAIFSPTGGNVGIGFAIPTSLAKPIIEQLKEFGKAHRGWLGVKIQDVTKEVANSVGLAKAMGALVVETTDGGPAQQAGVEAGDIITHFNGKEIAEMRFLPRMVAETKIGSKATLTVWRKGSSKQLSMTIKELKDEELDEQSSNGEQLDKLKQKGEETLLGLSLVPLNEALKQELSLPKSTTGVVVTKVDRSSEAARRGLRPSDAIVEINNSKIKDVSHFKRLIEDAKKAGRDYALLRVIRGDQSAFLTLPIK